MKKKTGGQLVSGTGVHGRQKWDQGEDRPTLEVGWRHEVAPAYGDADQEVLGVAARLLLAQSCLKWVLSLRQKKKAMNNSFVGVMKNIGRTWKKRFLFVIPPR